MSARAEADVASARHRPSASAILARLAAVRVLSESGFMASSFWRASATPAKYAKDDLPDVICLTFEPGRNG
jgi:hypothetical protein